jgi:anti-sigma factor RsiW
MIPGANQAGDIAFLERVMRFQDGALSQEEIAALEQELTADAENRALFIATQLRSMALHERFRRRAFQVVPPKSDVARNRNKPLWLKPAWLALAACLVVLAGLAVFFEIRRDGFAMQVVEANDARLQGREELLSVGEELQKGELVLESGFLRLRLSSGVLLDLNAPLRATMESRMRLRLIQGRLSADVGKHGKGFTVATDAGEVVDLGTRFGVEADAAGESRVAVFSGQVKVRPASGEFTTINEGEAVRFTALAGLKRWTEVALAANAAGLERVPAEGVIAALRDNLGDDTLHPFYGVVRAGMQPGALAFTDKPNPRWAPGPEDSLPAWLRGADLVRTYHQFRLQRAYELTLTLREASAVFVLIDTRQAAPDWLNARFTDTGARVRVGPWMRGMAGAEDIEVDSDGLPYLSFAVWRADAPAGEFALGPAHVRKDKALPFALMYGVAVKAHHSAETNP